MCRSHPGQSPTGWPDPRAPEYGELVGWAVPYSLSSQNSVLVVSSTSSGSSDEYPTDNSRIKSVSSISLFRLKAPSTSTNSVRKP